MLKVLRLHKKITRIILELLFRQKISAIYIKTDRPSPSSDINLMHQFAEITSEKNHSDSITYEICMPDNKTVFNMH